MKNNEYNDVHTVGRGGLVELIELLIEMEEKCRDTDIEERKEDDLWIVLDKDGNEITL